MPQQIPSLGYALLGLIQQKPSSGYDLRKMFSSTSMKTYSDSPGAIYPALRRLEKQAFIRSTIEERSGLRRRQVFRLTPAGLTELRKWITTPVTREDIRGPEGILLRFAFSEQVAGAAASVELLRSLETALKPHLAGLRAEFESVKGVAPTSGRLAFEFGLRGAEVLLQWTKYAIKTYEKQAKSK